MNGKLGKTIRRMAQQGKSVDEIHEIAYVYCAIFNAQCVKDSTVDKITEHYRLRGKIFGEGLDKLETRGIVCSQGGTAHGN